MTFDWLHGGLVVAGLLAMWIAFGLVQASIHDKRPRYRWGAYALAWAAALVAVALIVIAFKF
jgi:hypothetical protein